MDNIETLDIIHQDNTIVAIHKPSGLLVHKSPIDRHETRYAMRILRDQLGHWVYPVHRLDKPTSGLLLFALDKESASFIGKQFEAQQVSKQYLALVRGYSPASGLIDHPLKEIAAFKSDAGLLEDKQAKEAQTRYRQIARYELPWSDGRFETSRYSLLELNPLTGRKHQIRRHLKHISHPIIGDVKYGKGFHNRFFKDQFSNQRLLLACSDMTFTHPEHKEEFGLSCPLAKDFADILNQIEPYKLPSITTSASKEPPAKQ